MLILISKSTTYLKRRKNWHSAARKLALNWFLVNTWADKTWNVKTSQLHEF